MWRNMTLVKYLLGLQDTSATSSWEGAVPHLVFAETCSERRSHTATSSDRDPWSTGDPKERMCCEEERIPLESSKLAMGRSPVIDLVCDSRRIHTVKMSSLSR